MSFTWFRPEGPLRTREQVAREVHAVSLARGLDELATVIALMTISTEVGTGTGDDRKWWCPANDRVPATKNYPHDSRSDDNRSSGYFQQQPGPNGEPWWGTPENMMTLPQAANTFLERLSDDYRRAANNPRLAGEFAQRVQQSEFPDRYADKWDEAWSVLRRALGSQPPTTPEVPMPENRPPYNEFPIWSENHYNTKRAANDIDAFLLHTSEGFVGRDDAAEALSLWYQPRSRQVAYHYAVSQASDGGVTVVDNVDTDYASWSALSANGRSINLCFAGTRAAWSRNEWLGKFGNAIDVAAYLAVQDCKKYNIPTKVIAPPYTGRLPGITDHRYVTQILKDGTHTDVGDGFPWDYFTERVNHWANGGKTEPEPPKVKRFPDDWTDRELAVETLRQQRGYTLNGWPQLGGRTVVDVLGAIGEKLGVEGCYDVKDKS
ncbi:endolysin [Mycobacterium phage Job42]|uniref:Lysin A n=1 Tax=Mycobacterium phage Minnie TaxID=2653764 RepID=A0A5Q2WMA5_9CAUD|nr:endolysin [Mycobacterium phage Job42]YP_009959905.1 endolysin [Mycobacterium phage Minnie]AGM61450.1 lysin A [Mycobacterium phage Job42]QGH79604.1 lysin A [Mycobacterium phage Minnie]